MDDPVRSGGMAQGRPDSTGQGSDPASPVRERQFLGDYELLEPVGSGSHGTVWRARSAALRADVAVKILHRGPDSDDLTRLEREAAVLARLDHPHIVRVIDLVADGDRQAIVTEFATGGSLDARLTAASVGARDAVKLLAPIAAALHSTHQHGLVHGDLKPANILLTSDDQPLLADFGVAGWLDDGSTGQAEGTHAYLAPELAAGLPPSARTDVFALGVVAHELLVGERPDVASGWSSPLLDLPISDALARLVTRACSRDSAERVESAAVFGELLALTPEAQPNRSGESAPGLADSPDGDVATGRGGSTRPHRAARSTGVDDGETRPFGPQPPERGSSSATAAPGLLTRMAVIGGVGLLVLVLVVVAVLLGG